MDAKPLPSSPATCRIRPGELDDLPRLTEIYNHYVRETAITFDIEPYTVEKRRAWLDQFALSGPHRLFVAEEDGQVLGYAGTTSFRPKAAYETTVEATIYCDPGATGRGLGTRLYDALFEAIEGEDIRVVMAGATLPNDASIALHERFGFALVGVMHEVGRKFGRYWDVIWYERSMG